MHDTFQSLLLILMITNFISQTELQSSDPPKKTCVTAYITGHVIDPCYTPDCTKQKMWFNKRPRIVHFVAELRLYNEEFISLARR
jgi:hypothetical protein